MLVSLFLHPVSYTRKEERDRFAGIKISEGVVVLRLCKFMPGNFLSLYRLICSDELYRFNNRVNTFSSIQFFLPSSFLGITINTRWDCSLIF